MTGLVNFKERLRSKELLVGTWIKTPSTIVTEVLSGSDLDVLCLDAEHAPFDRGDLDTSILAARASRMPVVVRVPSAEPHQILNALDLGATGVVVPHVRTGNDARALADACFYKPAGRGYAGSSRAANYTRRKMAEHIAISNAGTTLIAQIEDKEGVDNIAAICTIDDLDCVFIGRADLAVAYGVESAGAPEVIAASERVCTAARRAGRAVGMFVPDRNELPKWISLGVSLFLLESDHTFLLRGAADLKGAFKALG